MHARNWRITMAPIRSWKIDGCHGSLMGCPCRGRRAELCNRKFPIEWWKNSFLGPASDIYSHLSVKNLSWSLFIRFKIHFSAQSTWSGWESMYNGILILQSWLGFTLECRLLALGTNAILCMITLHKTSVLFRIIKAPPFLYMYLPYV